MLQDEWTTCKFITLGHLATSVPAFLSSIFCIEASQNQHAVTITEEPVLLPDRFFVGFSNEFMSCKGTHQHQQRGSWKVKIGQQSVHLLHFIGRADEDIRRSAPGVQWSLRLRF